MLLLVVAFGANAHAVSVVSFAVSTNSFLGPPAVNTTVFCDKIVIANPSPPTVKVPAVNVIDGAMAGFGVVEDDVVSLVSPY
jgi:hypothetical protein